MIQLEHLSKSFGAFTAVNDLNLNIAEGEIFGFLGPNGAGKTTTIRMMMSLLSPMPDAFLVGTILPLIRSRPKLFRLLFPIVHIFMKNSPDVSS